MPRPPLAARRPSPEVPDAAGAPALHPGWYPARSLAGTLPGLVAGFSTALPRRPEAALAAEARALTRRFAAPDAPPEAVPAPLLLRQTHSPHVLTLDGARPLSAAPPVEDGAPPFDGASAEAGGGHLLAVKVADCVPVLAVDAAHGRYAALHAGWRGTAAGIVETLLDAWRAAGSDLRAVRLELGPHIQGCCYEVQADCLAHFSAEEQAAAVQRREGRTWLHLAAVLEARAVRAGVPAAQIAVSPHCTYCHRAADGSAPYASYRRATHAGAPFAATNLGLIGVLPGA